MAKMTIAKSTNKPICSKGAIALMMDFSTTCRPKKSKVRKDITKQQACYEHIKCRSFIELFQLY